MGLFCQVTIDDYGIPAETPNLGWPIDYSEAWELFCEVFYENAVRDVPVDTGNLLSSIGYEYDDTGCSCWADAEYAQYVEFGTWKMDAQPYFIPALEEAEREISSLLVEIYNDAVQEEIEELERQAEEEAEEEEEGDEGGGGGFSLVGAIIGALIVALVKTVIQAVLNPSKVESWEARYNAKEGTASFKGTVGSIIESLVEIT